VRYLKKFEAYRSFDEYRLEIMDFLKRYNMFPTQLTHLMDFYEDEMLEWYESGKYSREFANRIANDLNLDSGGLMQYGVGPGAKYQQIKYL
jgi:hypothetical protein